jgi:LPS-assembly protein
MVEYEYIPDLDQEDYPNFNSIDRIDAANVITYSMVNTFTTRRGRAGDYLYNQPLRLELSQDYDYNIERDQDGDFEPFGPVKADLQLDLGSWCDLQADADWSIYSEEFTAHNIAYRFSDGRGDTFSLQHRYSESLQETLKVSATLKLSDSLWLFPEYERNIEDDHMVTSGMELIYRAQCWSVSAQYVEDYEEEGVERHMYFTLKFYGLGDIGQDSGHIEGLPAWAQ